MSEWRPIATAPRQTMLLLAHEEFAGWFEVGECCALGDWYRRLSHEPLDKAPTHWMPLPDAPPCAMKRAYQDFGHLLTDVAN